MNYEKLYYSLIEGLKEKRKGVQTMHGKRFNLRRHHIKAICDGGERVIENKVSVNLREQVLLSIIYAKMREGETCRPMFSPRYIMSTTGYMPSPPLFRIVDRMHREACRSLQRVRYDDRWAMMRMIDRLLYPEKYAEACARGVRKQYERNGPNAFKLAQVGVYDALPQETKDRMKACAPFNARDTNYKRSRFPWRSKQRPGDPELWAMADKVWYAHNMLEIPYRKDLLREIGFDPNRLGYNATQVCTMIKWFERFGHPQNCKDWVAFKEDFYNG